MGSLVTIYILNYNYGQYLEQCIDSVLAQSYENFEFIIIDDGSTDDSITVLDQYVGMGINIIKQRNIGLVKSIYKAFSISNGKYVVRVDADDWVEKDFLKCLVCEIEKNEDIAMVFPDYYEVNEQGSILHRVKRHNFSTDVTILDQPAHGACTLTRRDAYFDVGGHNQNIECQDGVDIWLSITNKYSVSNHKEPLFFYRKHGSSITTNFEKILDNRSIIFRDHAKNRGYKKISVIAFIPIRSQIYNGKEFSLHLVGKQTLLDITIEKALLSTEVTSIVVSTDSLLISNYVMEKYIDIEVHIRNENITQQGKHINLSIKDYFLSKNELKISSLVILTPHSPFSTYQYIDTAVFSSYLFNTAVVDSVIEDASIMYYHDGHGMKKMHGSDIRNERDYVYIRKGGITFYSLEAVNSVVFGEIKTKGIGHILITKNASFDVNDEYSLKVAGCILICNNKKMEK